MRTACTPAALALLLAVLTGCDNPTANVPPAAEAPVVALPVARVSDLPSLAPQSAPTVTLGTAPSTVQAAAGPPPPEKPARRKLKPATPLLADQPHPEPATQPPAQVPSQSPAPATQAASGQPPEMSPIGQLSTSNESENTPNRHSILDLINSTENGLDNLKRTLDSEERKTVAQARTFLAKARDALNTDDLDGAHTLATKAHVLLDELTQP